jgi:hypothetical protein
MPAEGHLLFIVNVNTRGLLVHILVNDITVYTNNGRQASFGGKINPFILPAGNIVTVALGLPPSAPDPPRFRMNIQRAFQGADPGEEGILSRFTWSGQSLAPAPAEVFRGAFDAPEIWWRPRWISLPPVLASNAELERFVLDFVHSLQTGDIERLTTLHMPSFLELQDSLGFDAEQLASNFRERLRALMADPTFTVLPVDLRRLRYTPEAGGRMVRISLESGDPPIMTQRAEGFVPFAFTVSRVDGQLRIIR